MDSIENVYQGEDWEFTIEGDMTVDITANDFMVLIYPCGEPTSEHLSKIKKSECTATENPNEYKGKVPYTATKTKKVGFYTVEVLLVESTGQTRSVFSKFRGICCQPSASKNVDRIQ